jgi:proline racemase
MPQPLNGVGSCIDRLTTVGPYDAVVPRISGQACITEIGQVGLDPADPFRTGYVLSDTWPAGN